MKNLNKLSVKRFVDEDATAEISKSPNINSSKVLDTSASPRSYYNGDLVYERMNKVRETINHIRQHWDQYDSFMASLKEYAVKNGFSLKKNYKGVEGLELFCRREWSEVKSTRSCLLWKRILNCFYSTIQCEAYLPAEMSS